MPSTDCGYMAIVANANKSLSRIHFKEGLTVERMEINDLFEELSEIDGPPSLSQKIDVFDETEFEEGRAFFTVIRGRFTSDSIDPKPIAGALGDVGRFQRDYEKEILMTLDSCMLFGECAPYLSRRYYTYVERATGRRRLLSVFFGGIRYVNSQMNLTDNDVERINANAKNGIIPLEPSYLQFAFENLKLSYKVPDPGMMHVCLTTALESMLCDGGSETRYKLSRNGAVLLGKDRKDCEDVKKKIAEIYDRRSAIVHGPHDKKNSKNTKEFDIFGLRYIVRQTILALLELSKEQDELFELLTATGYDETKEWRKSNQM